MTVPTNNTLPSEVTQTLIPDIRQSVCHTLLAGGFLLINLQNPLGASENDAFVTRFFLLALPVIVVISWRMFFRRLKRWKTLSADIRNRITRSPKALKSRAVSHLLMALIAAGLTAIGYIGHLISPLQETYGLIAGRAILIGDGIIGTLSIAVFSACVRDIATYIRALRPVAAPPPLAADSEESRTPTECKTDGYP